MRVSFDYDGTLDNPPVQQYAKELIHRGVEVWIVSAREHATRLNPSWNNDLFSVAKGLGIPKFRVMLTAMQDKYHFFNHWDGFIWHLDDNWEECLLVTSHTDTIGVPYSKHKQWKAECDKLIRQSTLKGKL